MIFPWMAANTEIQMKGNHGSHRDVTGRISSKRSGEGGRHSVRFTDARTADRGLCLHKITPSLNDILGRSSSQKRSRNGECPKAEMRFCDFELRLSLVSPLDTNINCVIVPLAAAHSEAIMKYY
jgi:hypothetical protein